MYSLQNEIKMVGNKIYPGNVCILPPLFHSFWRQRIVFNLLKWATPFYIKKKNKWKKMVPGYEYLSNKFVAWGVIKFFIFLIIIYKCTQESRNYILIFFHNMTIHLSFAKSLIICISQGYLSFMFLVTIILQGFASCY